MTHSHASATVRMLLAACLLFITGSAFAVDALQPPDQVIKAVAEETLKDLDAHRAEYKKDPKQIRVLVDKHLLPHFDTQLAARRVLAKYWTTATADQRSRFIEAFYQLMLERYGEALVDFTPDKLKILPLRSEPDATTATVRSEIRRDNGTVVPVNYSMTKGADGWKVYDVTISGVSYVKSIQTDYAAAIERDGLEAVIKRLESQVAAGGAPAKG